MPKEKKVKEKPCLYVDNLRHNEYYGMQEVFDDLYARSKRGEVFTDLMSVILKRENILLAYRNIKTNAGSNTAGTDGLTIQDIGRLSPDDVVEKVRYILVGSQHGYRPKPVKRVEIPKHNGDKRPLGIPCIWDRLVQQCIKQVLEPICEAKFSEHSHGFRPNRSVEHAIAEAYVKINRSHLYYVVEFDIKSFFDNVDHQKLLQQIWTIGIRDKVLKSKLKRIIKAPIKLPNNTLIYPNKGTPQGGIISPLLANIVLNELDHWVESNWEYNPVAYKYSVFKNSNGSENKGNGYRAMKNTKLKEMYIVRYADDFRIFCRTKKDAENTKVAITQWLLERLKLEVSPEKTRVINVKRKYSEFLGFKMKARYKGNQLVVRSHMADKQLKQKKRALIKQAKKIARPDVKRGEVGETHLYNSMVVGLQNYYCIATDVSKDFAKLDRAVMTVLTNRLRAQGVNRLTRAGRALTSMEKTRYGGSKMLRYVAGSEEPIYPVGYVQHKNALSKNRLICSYTTEGRTMMHDNLRINVSLLLKMMRQRVYGRSIEYTDNRISLFSAQAGKCAVTGRAFDTIDEIHCHHKVPQGKGGTDVYDNLVLVTDLVHKLIHAETADTIEKYKLICNLDAEQMKKLNKLRMIAGYAKIA